MDPKVSVIVPIYNVEQHLKKCIDSIIGQTYTNLEIILVDDGSPDNCPAICDEYKGKDNRIKVIHKENGGISDARNAGIKEATGKYIAFVDSDDWLDYDLLNDWVKCAERNNADAVCYNPDIKNERVIKKDILINYFLDGRVSVWSKLWHIKLFEGFSFIKGAVSEDVIASYTLLKDCEVMAEIPRQNGYNYNVNIGSISRSVFKNGDYDAVNFTSQVADDVYAHFPDAYKFACLHIYKAMFNVINKAFLYGLDENVDPSIFNVRKKEYIKTIRRNLFSILKYKYFSKNDKKQIIVLCISEKLFRFLKRKYKKLRA
ncbi:MAG: glycosyltransferase family 2 protein [Eubacteriales bacterium]